jgi:hypothetical protein
VEETPYTPPDVSSSTPVAPSEPPEGLLSRFFGIVFSPSDTYKKIVERPRWLDMLVLTTAIIAVFVGSFLSTEVGREAWMDQVIESTRSSAGEVSDDQIEAFEKIQPYVGLFGVGQTVIFAPLMSLVFSGILYVVFSIILGATATFRQLFTITVHSGVVSTIQAAFTWTLNYFRGVMTSPTSFASLLPMVEEGTFVYKFLNVMDLFVIWWLVVLSIGLGILYKIKTTGIAISLFVVYTIIALVVAAAF